MALITNVTRCSCRVPALESSIRTIHTSQPVFKVGATLALRKMAQKQVKFITKLTQRSIERDKIRKNVVSSREDTALPSSQHYFQEFEPRRVRLLEHMFLEHITELLATEEFTQDLDGFTVDVTSVQINRRNNQINVLWAPRGSEEEDRQVHKMLTHIAPRLRLSLQEQQLMGSVPKLEFLQDKTLARLREMEALFSKVDCGPEGGGDPSREEGGEGGEGREVLEEVTVTASLNKGVTLKVTNEHSERAEYNERFEHLLKRTDTGGIDRQALLEQLTHSPRPVFKKRDRA